MSKTTEFGQKNTRNFRGLELWGFEDFSLASDMLSATIKAANSAQIYPKTKLRNTTKN
jgi:hypothetical protein